MCEWSVITLAFSLDVPHMVVHLVFLKACKRKFEKAHLPCKPLTNTGTAGSCHHNVAGGKWAVVSGSHSAPFLVCVVLSGAWQK